MHLAQSLAHNVCSIYIIQRSVELTGIGRAILLMVMQDNVKQRCSFIQQVFIKKLNMFQAEIKEWKEEESSSTKSLIFSQHLGHTFSQIGKRRPKAGQQLTQGDWSPEETKVEPVFAQFAQMPDAFPASFNFSGKTLNCWHLIWRLQSLGSKGRSGGR